MARSRPKPYGLPGLHMKPNREQKGMLERKEQLRAAGLRSTGPRIAVLRELEVARGPVSHAELADKLASEGFDRATVYRNLIDLAEAGIAIRSDHGDHIWRFELRAAAQSGAHSKDAVHPHFVCTECGTVSCLPETAVRIGTGNRIPRSLAERRVEVQVKGTCDTCS